MANAFTSTDSATLGTSLVQTAYDRYVEKALRSQVLIRDIVDKRPVQQAMPGSSVTLQLYNDLAVATTPLTETVDPDAVAMPQTTSVSVTLNEYGNSALVTRKLQAFALSDVDPEVVEQMAYNRANSLDTLVLTTLRGGTNRYAGTADGTVATTALGSIAGTSRYNSAIARTVTAKLRSANVQPKRGELFWTGIHPDVSADFRAETGAAGWRVPHEYNSNTNLWNGEVGTYEGQFYVESPRMYYAADGASSARVYRTITVGKQALAEAVAIEPHTVIGEITDKLKRFRPIGWYGLLGWARFREAAIWRVESGSSLATL